MRYLFVVLFFFCCIASAKSQRVSSLAKIADGQVVYTGHGIAPFKKDGKWGFVDSLNHVLIDPIYDSLWSVDLGYKGAAAAKNDKGIYLFDRDFNPLFDGPLKSLRAAHNSYYDMAPDSEYWHHVDDLAKDNGFCTVSGPQTQDWQPNSYSYQGRRFLCRVTPDSIFHKLENASDPGLVFGAKIDALVYPMLPRFVATKFPNHYQLFDLTTGKTVVDSAFVSYFQHNQKWYRISSEGVRSGARDGTTRDHHFDIKCQSFSISDESGKIVRKYDGMPVYVNGLILEKVYDAGRQAYVGIRAQYFDSFEPLDSIPFGSYERPEGRHFLKLTHHDGRFSYVNLSGKVIYKGDKTENVYAVETGGDTLFRFGQSYRMGGLMTMDGKVLINKTDCWIDARYGTNTGTIIGIPYYAKTTKQWVYHASDQTVSILDYREMIVLSDSNSLLVKDRSDYKLIDDYGTVRDSLNVDHVLFIKSGKKGILIGYVPEWDKSKRRQKLKAIEQKKKDEEYQLDSIELQPWRALYFDQQLRPINFPEEYELRASDLDGLIYFSAPSKPGYFGVMKTDGTIVIPNDYRAINDVNRRYFVVFDDKGILMGYIRPDGTKLF